MRDHSTEPKYSRAANSEPIEAEREKFMVVKLLLETGLFTPERIAEASESNMLEELVEIVTDRERHLSNMPQTDH